MQQVTLGQLVLPVVMVTKDKKAKPVQQVAMVQQAQVVQMATMVVKGRKEK